MVVLGKRWVFSKQACLMKDLSPLIHSGCCCHLVLSIPRAWMLGKEGGRLGRME